MQDGKIVIGNNLYKSWLLKLKTKGFDYEIDWKQWALQKNLRIDTCLEKLSALLPLIAKMAVVVQVKQMYIIAWTGLIFSNKATRYYQIDFYS